MKYCIILIAFLILSVKQAESRPASLDYIFQKRDSTSLLITVSFTGDRSGATILRLPNEWAGQKMLYRTVSQLTAVSKETAIDTTAKPYEYLIKHAPGASVKLTYVLSKDWQGRLVYPYYFRPVIANDYFFFEGYSGLAYPDLPDSVSLKCSVEYRGFPQSDFMGNSFFANKSKGSFTTTLNNLANSFFCAGNYRTKTVDLNGHKIVMAVNGKFLFSDEDAFSSISKIILEERRFWNDASAPYFFTTLMPMEDQGNTGGTAHYNSFFLFQSTNLGIADGALSLIAHEYFHTWIGQGLSMPQPNEVYKWFSEGFTDYYSYKLLNIAGIVTSNDFKAKINRYVKEYYLSPYFNYDNQQIVGKYWDDRNLKDLSYRRGLTIAFMLESKISEKGGSSLDDLMRELYAKSKPSLVFSKPLFDELVTKYAGASVLSDINNANSGHNYGLTQRLLDNKLYKTGAVSITKIFDMGFDFDASKRAKKVTGLKHGSNAEKAGLAQGMELTNKYSIYFNNTENPLKVQVVRNGNAEWLSYIPVDDVNITVPQLAISE